MADVTFQDMQQIGEAPSELAKRSQVKQAQVREFESVPSFFAEEQRRSQSQAKLAEVRADSRALAEQAKQREMNFDEGLKNQRRLARLDANVSRQLLDDELKFKEDSAGRKLMSERQLLDWYATRARSEEDWSNFEARSNQIHARKIQFLEAAYAKLETEERKLYAKFKSNLDIDTKKFLAERKAQLRKELEKAKTKAKNKQALISGVASAAGAAGGALGSVGGPVGTAAGAAAGTFIGTKVGEVVADKAVK